MDDTTQQSTAAPSEARQTHAWSLLFAEYHEALTEGAHTEVSTPGLDSDTAQIGALVCELLAAEFKLGSCTTVDAMVDAIGEGMARRFHASHDMAEQVANDLATWQVRLMVEKDLL